jgi:predicted porin
MKKTLVALAALAATAAFAQSTVTISGAVATALNSNTTTNGAGASTNSLQMFNNPTGTTNVTFSGVEDLGGGMKGLFLYEIDPNANYANFAAPAGELFVGISGGFGSVKLGSPNQPSLTTQASRNPYGTKTGGGFGGVMGASKVRQQGSIVYTSNDFSGFSFGLAYSPETPTSAAAGVAPGAAQFPGVNPISGAAVVTPGAAQMDLGLNYANGPLAAGLSFNTQDAIAVGSVSVPAGAAGLRQTNYYIQYAFGNARVYFGGHTEDVLSAAGVATNDNGNNLGIKYTMSNVDLMANFAVKRNAAAGTDQRIWGLGVDYNFSKRTAAVARINQANNDGVAAAATAESRNIMVGLIHKF